MAKFNLKVIRTNLFIMKILSLLLFAMLLSACYFFGPVDETQYKQPGFVPTVQQLAGKWKADPGSYKLIKAKKVYKIDSLYMVLHNDSTFEAVNFPDFVNNNTELPVNGELYNASGKWRIDNYDNRPSIDLSFSTSAFFKVPTSRSIQIYSRVKDSKLVLWLWVGDPDEGNCLLFVKE